MNADYWAHCRGVNGTKAVYKYYRSATEARIGGRVRWDQEHPGEPLARFFVDGVETTYEKQTVQEYV